MKRVIDGKAYNTQTATKLACANGIYKKQEYGEKWRVKVELFRTKGGAFFTVKSEWTGCEYGEEELTVFKPISYDDAYLFALGKSQFGQVDLYPDADNVFPSIPDAEETITDQPTRTIREVDLSSK